MKPASFSLDKFKSKRAAAAANVDTALTALPHHAIAQAKDFVRLHPSEDILVDRIVLRERADQGAKKEQLHLIDEDLTALLSSGKVLRFRIGVGDEAASTSFSVSHPDANTDNAWNMSNLPACASREGRNGCKRRRVRARVPKPTRSTSLGIRTRSPSRSGRRCR